MWIDKINEKKIRKPYKIDNQPMQVWENESKLNELGIYTATFEYIGEQDKRYYDIVETVNYSTAVITYTSSEKDIEVIKSRMMRDLEIVLQRNLKFTVTAQDVADSGLTPSETHAAKMNEVYQTYFGKQSEISAIALLDKAKLYEAYPHEREEENEVGEIVTTTVYINLINDWEFSYIWN